MAASFLKEYLLTQLCKLGIEWPPKKEEEKSVKVQQTIAEAGYCPSIPTDDIPVALIPGMLRLDKQSWLNALSIEASFSTDVEDGDLVYPVAINVSGDFISNVAELRDAVWKPVNQVSGTASKDDSQPRIWGIAYKHIGRVMFGPIVFHTRFAFKTGDILYVGKSGEITTENVGAVLGVCLAPGSIFIDLSVTSSKLALDALQERVDKLEQNQESSSGSISDLTEEIRDIQNELNNKLENGDNISNSTVTASGSTTARPLKDRFADVVNVKDFGAVGDGRHDDTEAIQKAFSFAKGRTVFFPAGTYIAETSDISGAVISDGAILTTPDGTTWNLPIINLGISATLIGSDISKPDNIIDVSSKQLTMLGRGCGRNIGQDADTSTGIGQGVFSGETLDDEISDYGKYNGIDNVGIGYHACKRITTGDMNVGIGRDALNVLTTGNNNTAVGGSALQQLQKGDNNTALGRNAGIRCGVETDPSGFPRIKSNDVNNNTLIGSNAGREIKTGDNNTYIGYSSGRGVTNPDNTFTGTSTGHDNVAVGALAMSSIGSGSYNVIVGRSSGNTISDGNLNTLIGYNAGKSVETNNAVIIGASAAEESQSANGAIIIGYRAGKSVSNLDNTLLIGGSGGLPFMVGTMTGDGNTLRTDASMLPATADKYNLGSAAYLWDVVFASSPDIVTSDMDKKQSIEDYPDDVLDAWGEVKFRQFLFKDAVERKGDAARVHSGIIAQQVVEAFKKHGVDATKYGLLCFDRWDSEYETVEVVDTPASELVVDMFGNPIAAQTHKEQRLVTKAGSRYGIRYSEALCLEAAYQRRRASCLEARVAALETAIQNLNLPNTSGEEPTNE